MKKSLLVAPALGVLLLAAAGSVGGTVAWFSSVSSVEASVGVFESKAMDGNLALTVTQGTGTSVDNSNAVKSVSMTSGDVLTHASYDHTTKKFCTRSTENDSGVREVTNTLVAKEDYSSTNDIYYGVTWTMTFTYTFESENYANLYFSSESTQTDGTTGGTTKDGFRIAFVGSTNDANAVANTRIWANERPESGTNTPKYIASSQYSSNSDIHEYANATAYNTNEVIGTTYMDLNKIVEGTIVYQDTQASYAPGLIGRFAKPASPTDGKYISTITFACAAWFEGTDASIVTDGSVMSAVSTSMKFYVREYKASNAPAQNP